MLPRGAFESIDHFHVKVKVLDDFPLHALAAFLLTEGLNWLVLFYGTCICIANGHNKGAPA